MERFLYFAIGLSSLVLNVYILMTVKGVDMKAGFMLNLLSGKFKEKVREKENEE